MMGSQTRSRVASAARSAVAYPFHVGSDVRGDEDRRAAPERGDDIEDVPSAQRVERSCRLIEQERRRDGDHRLGDSETLLHASRTTADGGIDTGQAGQVEHDSDATSQHWGGMSKSWPPSVRTISAVIQGSKPGTSGRTPTQHRTAFA